MPLNVAHQIVGKTSICWECGEPFEMNVATMELRQPKCMGCRIGVDEDTMSEYLKKKGQTWLQTRSWRGVLDSSMEKVL